ncbi:hypothetical protein FZ103_00675 [Streptomonospora sp. PA3]|uniref:hypothetical protein n=1 Tax=Streptomonospora sp. PA3 TaxID=2607326 RepID=UPI0012DDBAA1|nr:hypothetical protein [Streptomonospora sp. PA3]MUL39706.1 hypothetical protein [Streptomonospora sp. PA3]
MRRRRPPGMGGALPEELHPRNWGGWLTEAERAAWERPDFGAGGLSWLWMEATTRQQEAAREWCAETGRSFGEWLEMAEREATG